MHTQTHTQTHTQANQVSVKHTTVGKANPIAALADLSGACFTDLNHQALRVQAIASQGGRRGVAHRHSTLDSSIGSTQVP